MLAGTLCAEALQHVQTPLRVLAGRRTQLKCHAIFLGAMEERRAVEIALLIGDQAGWTGAITFRAEGPQYALAPLGLFAGRRTQLECGASILLPAKKLIRTVKVALLIGDQTGLRIPSIITVCAEIPQDGFAPLGLLAGCGGLSSNAVPQPPFRGGAGLQFAPPAEVVP